LCRVRADDTSSVLTSVLTRAHRLTSSRAFAETIRRGRRAGTGTLVLHLAQPAESGAGSANDRPVQIGLVVSKAVGNAVRRNQAKRRLRHLVRERLSSLPGSAVLVVRALPSAAEATSAELGADFDVALHRLRRRRTVGTSS